VSSYAVPTLTYRKLGDAKSCEQSGAKMIVRRREERALSEGGLVYISFNPSHGDE
jgi:hypothetical protein